MVKLSCIYVMETKNPEILGVDCGNVIFRSWSGLPLPGSFDNLRKIVQSGRFEKVYVISKIPYLLRFTFAARLWYFNFWNYTGIPRNHLYFCSHYQDKAVICEKLGVTHFVDDRLQVLSYMKTVGNLYAFQPRLTDRELKKYPEVLKEATVVESWQELSPLLLAN